MIPRKFRLSGRKNIEKVKSEGKFVQSDSFGLVYLDKSNDDKPRFGIIVSKKISSKATVRNKVKRMIRYNLMQLAARIKRGYDLMLLIKRNILDLDSLSFKKELESALKRESIIQ